MKAQSVDEVTYSGMKVQVGETCSDPLRDNYCSTPNERMQNKKKHTSFFFPFWMKYRWHEISHELALSVPDLNKRAWFV